MPYLSYDSAAAILANELRNIVFRIEALPANPQYTQASEFAAKAAHKLEGGRSDIHQRHLRNKFSGGA